MFFTTVEPDLKCSKKYTIMGSPQENNLRIDQNHVEDILFYFSVYYYLFILFILMKLRPHLFTLFVQTTIQI